MSEMPQNKVLRLLTQILGLGFVAHACWLTWIQWINPAQPEERAESTTRTTIKNGCRGMILDAKRIPLAMSQTVFTLRVDPVVLSTNATDFVRAVGPLLGLTNSEFNAFCQSSNHIRRWTSTNLSGLVEPHAFTNRAVIVRTEVLPADWDGIRSQLKTLFAVEQDRQASEMKKAKRPSHERDAAKLRWNQLRTQGLTGEAIEVRRYPHDSLAAHVVGFTTEVLDSDRRPIGDLAGTTGLERQFNELLRGRRGEVQTHVVKGTELGARREQNVPPVDGANLVLTLDLGIQSLTESALATGKENGLQAARAEGGLKKLWDGVAVRQPARQDFGTLALSITTGRRARLTTLRWLRRRRRSRISGARWPDNI